MFEVADEQYQKLTPFIFHAFDYDRLLSNPPTDKKGKIVQHKWQKQAKQAETLYNQLLGIHKPKLTEKENKRLIELNQLTYEREQAKKRGIKFKKEDIWRSMLAQSQPNSKQT